MARQSWHKHIPWIRLAITVFAVLVVAFCVGLIVYGSTSTSNDIALGILAGITAILALGQWFFPFSPDRHEASHLPLASELVQSSFKMGDESAANFPYITAPIQMVYTLAKQALLDSSTGTSSKRGVLILGEANAGKTRMAFEVLTKTLPDWPVLRWWPDSTMDKLSLHEKHLVIFIDDLQDYVFMGRREADTSVFAADPHAAILRTSLERLRQAIPRVVVVATCRQENQEQARSAFSQLFLELGIIQVPSFDVDTQDPQTAEIIHRFQLQGSIEIENWDGTLGSLVLGLDKKNNQYFGIKDSPAGTVLHAMKLLWLAGTTVHTEKRVRSVCAIVLDERMLLESTKAWWDAVNQLIRLQFITVEESNVHKNGHHNDCCVTMYNEKTLNPVQT